MAKSKDLTISKEVTVHDIVKIAKVCDEFYDLIDKHGLTDMEAIFCVEMLKKNLDEFCAEQGITFKLHKVKL